MKIFTKFDYNAVCKKVLNLEKLDINKDFVESYEKHIVEYLCYKIRGRKEFYHMTCCRE